MVDFPHDVDYDQRFERLLEGAESSDGIAEEDRDVLLTTANELRIRSVDISTARAVKTLQHSVLLAGGSPKYEADELPEDNDIPPTRRGPDGKERVIDVDSVDDWLSFFSEKADDRAERGYETLDHEQYKPFAVMCATAGAVMCYSGPQQLYAGDLDPNEIRLLLSRVEAAVSPPRDAEAELRKALSWFARNPEADTDHASDDFSSFSDMPVFVPSVIVDSDHAAKFARDSMGTGVREELLNIIKELRKR